MKTREKQRKQEIKLKTDRNIRMSIRLKENKKNKYDKCGKQELCRGRIFDKI